MRRLTSYLLWTSAIVLGLVLFLSVIVTQERFYELLLKSNFLADSSISLAETNWQPLRPSIVVKAMTIKTTKQIIKAKDVKIEYSLFNLLKGQFLSKLNASEISVYYLGNKQDKTSNSIFRIGLLTGIQAINVKKITLYTLNEEVILKGSLFSVNKGEDPQLELIFKDSKSENLALRVFTQDETDGNLIRGHLKSSNFLVNQQLIDLFCMSCEASAHVTADLKFSFLQDKPIDFKGNLDVSFGEDFFGIKTVSLSYLLKDTETFTLQGSAFLNSDKSLMLPDFFLSFDQNEPFLFLPKIDLSKTKITKFFLKNYNSTFTFDGLLNDTSIDIENGEYIFKTSFKDIEFNSKDISVTGLEGSMSYLDGRSVFRVGSPLLSISSINFLDKQLDFDNFNFLAEFFLSSKGLEIYPSIFSGSLYGDVFNGLVSLDPTPEKSFGNLSLRVEADSIEHSSAFLLFPNTKYLSATKDTLKNLLTCGSIKGVELLYRGPIDGNYKNSSAKFGLNGLGEEICLNVNGYKIKKINGTFRVNDFNFVGNIENGDFQGSNLQANIQTFKDEKIYSFQVEGNSNGPFSTILNSFLIKDEKISSIKGFHSSTFSFNSPLKQNISLLSPFSDLKIHTEIKKGGFNFDELGFNLNNLFSSIKYDSSSGPYEGFISLKLNSIPFSFEIDEALETPFYKVFSSKEIVKLEKIVPEFLKKKISGSSEFLVNINVPSLKKGIKIKRPFINLTSSLVGTKVSIPEPFNKTSIKGINLDLNYYPIYEDGYSRLKFKYGNLLRGKFDISSNNTQGYLIAGEKKQSITTEQGIISLIGSFEKLDLSLLNLNLESPQDQPINFVIKKLIIDEISYADFSLPKTEIYSEPSSNYYVLNLSNKDLVGTLSLPTNNNFLPLIDLDFLKIAFEETGNNSVFLNIFNNFNTGFKFETNSLILNSNEYGNWKFDFVPSDSSMTFENLEGIYGKWGLTKTNKGISRLSIVKNSLGWESLLESKIYSGSPEKGFKQLGINPNFEMDTFAVETDIYWKSLPWDLRYEDITGEMKIDIKGLLIQDQKDIPTPNNLLRLINIFNVTDSFEKVTNLDFRKLYKAGFSADSVRGKLNISKNSISISQPLTFRSGSSEFKWRGAIAKEEDGSFGTLDFEVIMTLPLREYLPAYAFLLGGPVTAGIVYIAGKAFERNLDQLSSGAWTVKGTLSEPKTDFKGWFEKTDD